VGDFESILPRLEQGVAVRPDQKKANLTVVAIEGPEPGSRDLFRFNHSGDGVAKFASTVNQWLSGRTATPLGNASLQVHHSNGCICGLNSG
jgi:hypothetical protein